MADILADIPDIARLKARYLEERDKRLRPEGLTQYRAVDLDDGEYARDPFSPEMEERAPVNRDVDVVIVGGGHAGMLAAHGLVTRGIEDFLLIEKAAGLGGTWYWNRYPDCRCDIESYIYMPLLEDGGAMPAEKYARSSVIRANAARLGEKLGLFERALFHTGVTAMRWDTQASRWIIETDRGDTIRARFVCLGSGPMSRPKLPGIPGLENFKGRTFHTSRWDYDYTGGDETGGMTRLADKRVAIVGTGATACQVIPRLAADAGHLYVVQRTPAAVIERQNRPTDAAWWASLPKRWWFERATNFSAISVGQSPAQDLVQDKWTEMFGRFNRAGETEAEAARTSGYDAIEIADHRIMQELRDEIDRKVTDKATAESLKPWYNVFCKRPLFLHGYYETFNRPNVTLVDTQGRGLDRVTEDAIVFDGVEYPVDCIVFASGFEVAVPLDRAGGIDLTGKDGARLAENWRGGMVSLHGMFTHDFPNLCLIGGVRHAAFSWNVTYNLTLQGNHFAQIVRYCLDNDVRTFEVRPEAERKWLGELEANSAVDLQFLADCTPGYLNNEGADIATGIASQGYGAGVLAYAKKLEEWRESAIAEDFELTR